MMRRAILVAIVGVLMVVLTGCGGGSGGGSGVSTDYAVTSEGSVLTFDPATFNFKTGDTVNLTYTNNGSLEHDFVIEGMTTSEGKAISLKVAAGETGKISFTPTKDGEYTAFCSMAGHKDGGMTAKVTVSK